MIAIKAKKVNINNKIMSRISSKLCSQTLASFLKNSCKNFNGKLRFPNHNTIINIILNLLSLDTFYLF